MWTFKWKWFKKERPANDGDHTRAVFEANKNKLAERQELRRQKIQEDYLQVREKILTDAGNGYEAGYYHLSKDEYCAPVVKMLQNNGFQARETNHVRKIYVRWIW